MAGTGNGLCCARLSPEIWGGDGGIFKCGSGEVKV